MAPAPMASGLRQALLLGQKQEGGACGSGGVTGVKSWHSDWEGVGGSMLPLPPEALV